MSKFMLHERHSNQNPWHPLVGVSVDDVETLYCGVSDCDGSKCSYPCLVVDIDGEKYKVRGSQVACGNVLGRFRLSANALLVECTNIDLASWLKNRVWV